MHKIYKLKLLETWCDSNNTCWTRVLGGWVYSDMQRTRFVPFDNEFQDKIPSQNNKELNEKNT